MIETSLDCDWQFRQEGPDPGYHRSAVQYQQWLPATVPGHVHLDLVANGMIADPFAGMAELGARWVDEADWSYRCRFNWSPKEELPRRVLRFDGLDTVCRIYLNEELIGSHDNMFVPLEVDLSDMLVEGSNELRVDFESAVRIGDERRTVYMEAEGLPHSTAPFDERAFVRKAQYMSGWDWGPRLVSCGIWQPVRLLEFSARIVSFELLQERLEDGSFRVWSETATEGEGQLTVEFAGHRYEGDFSLVIDDPELWWPNGMGDQHMYGAAASFGDHRLEKKIGLRTIELVREPDSFGESFQFVVNGRRAWIRGANWIPNDSFPSRVTAEDYSSQIRTTKYLGMNMLRVWGGGLYELEAFYDACDREGILVWQDFAYGCSHYPDDPVWLDIARTEAEVQVGRLRSRTSLALWCGNNENEMMWDSRWGGKNSPPRYYGGTIYSEVIPSVLAGLDPHRPYIRSSPIGSVEKPTERVNEGPVGDCHYWDVWHGRGDWNFYRESDSRFCSEFGFASSCSGLLWSQVAPDASSPDDSTVRWHDKTGKAWETFLGYVTLHYPEPKTLEDWTYYSQLNQRDALQFGIEHFRRSSFCSGTLIWQFNDCWPVQSWAVQDSLRRLKPAGYELRRVYDDRLLSFDGEELWGINDSDKPWSGTVELFCVSTLTGSETRLTSVEMNLRPGERRALASAATDGIDRKTNILVANYDFGVVSARSLLCEPKELRIGPALFQARARDGLLELKVDGFVMDMVVSDPSDPDNLSTSLLPGPGIAAITGSSGTARYRYRVKPTSLYVRTLAGEQVIPVS